MNGYEHREYALSVVVPMYMVERYLRQCVDSLLAQGLDDMEIILVDDGSRDACGAIADAYAAEHHNIRAVHQKNQGLGPARNSGMAVASGEYIGFVDSDDWVKPHMYERLYAAAKSHGADICIGGHEDYRDGKPMHAEPHPYAGKTITDQSAIRDCREQLFGHLPTDTETKAFPMQVWTSLYRREFIEQNGLRFQNILSEDTMFNLDAYAAATCMTFTSDVDYCYRLDNSTSIMRGFSPKKLDQYDRFVSALHDKAVEDVNSDTALLRVSRTAIQYVRLYAGIVAGSSLSVKSKINELKRLTRTTMFMKHCEGYPLDTLPRGQRLFHEALEHQLYRLSLLLLSARRRMR